MDTYIEFPLLLGDPEEVYISSDELPIADARSTEYSGVLVDAEYASASSSSGGYCVIC